MMTELNLPWHISNSHGLCIVGADGRLVADLTPRSDWWNPHDRDQLEAYAKHIVDSVNGDGHRLPTLDLTNRAIRDMARYNHQPEELWTLIGTLHSVHCEKCYQSWPCSTAVDLERYQDDCCDG